MALSFDVVIIGAGVVGSAIARELSKYRIDIALLEKEVDVSFGTSKANSGIIHAGFHSPPDTLKAKLCVSGNRLFDRLSEELNFPFERRGEIVVAFSFEETQILKDLMEQGQKNNVQYLELLGRDRVLELEPYINPDVTAALYAPTAGIIGPYELCFALAENAAANGTRIFTNEQVIRIERRRIGNGFTIETKSGSVYKAKYLVNAAGLYADEIALMVGLHDFNIIPRKGEEYLLDRRVSNMVNHVIFPVPRQKSKGMLVIPTVDGPVMVGPTAEDMDVKTDFTTTREGLAKVFEHAQKMIPDIRSQDVITSFAGVRPVATGNDFIISPTGVPGFVHAAGIQSPGLTASPAIAEMVTQILLKEGLRMEANKDFNPYRQGIKRTRKMLDSGDIDELAEEIGKNPTYSNLVCRCENVTEAEIVEAVRRGHTTLDSLKFTTRAQSGRCQGGFCTHRIIQIIHRETGIPYEKITKKGPGSEVILYRTKKGGNR
jgi:glycerol-3-phosphate dehydrogenase